MKRQQGMALLVVLLILSLMTILAVTISERWQRSLQRTVNLQNQLQGKWYALAGEELTKAILMQDIQDSFEKMHLAQLWATQGRVFPLENALLEIAVIDEQSCFNLNAINQTISANSAEATSDGRGYPVKVLQQLLINLKVDEYEAEQIVAAIRDWIDEDDDPLINGAETNYYLSLDPPYMPANGPIKNVTELRAIKGIDAALYQRLRPFVCALPQDRLVININTLREIQAPLLAALFLDQLEVDEARELISNRPREGWESVADFVALDRMQKTASLGTQVLQLMGVRSRYFRVLVRVRFDDYEYQLNSLLGVTEARIGTLDRQYGIAQLKPSGS